MQLFPPNLDHGVPTSATIFDVLVWGQWVETGTFASVVRCGYLVVW